MLFVQLDLSLFIGFSEFLVFFDKVTFTSFRPLILSKDDIGHPEFCINIISRNRFAKDNKASV